MEAWACCRPALLTRMSRPAQTAHRAGDQVLAERLVTQVAWQGQSDAALGLDQRDYLARVGLFA